MLRVKILNMLEMKNNQKRSVENWKKHGPLRKEK